MMNHGQITANRQRLLARPLDLSAILRGSLLHRTIRHRQGCPKCARGQGHPVWILTVGYPGGRTRQISLRKEVVPQVRRWLHNYRRIKGTLERVCELNQQLLRPDPATRRSRSSSRA
jgi:hypothetical protein